MKTFNRGKLKRLAETGRLVVVESYHFDDMSGSSRIREEMPVVCKDGLSWQEKKDGTVYLDSWHFKSNSGRAYYTYDDRKDMVTLIVHSNSNYTFKILPE